MQPYRLFRWDEIALEKVTEMVSRKFVSGERETIAQIYLKRGAVVPQHAHDSEQMTYVLQGALKLLVAGDEVTLRDGEVLHIKPGVRIRWRRSTTRSCSASSALSAAIGWNRERDLLASHPPVASRITALRQMAFQE